MPQKEQSLYKKVHRQLKGAGLKARKSLGQNFLVDETVRDRIIEAAGISSDDTVLEVGPGLGVLTKKLAELAHSVIAVELDENLVTRLKNKLAGFTNLRIIHGDILSADLKTLVEGQIPYKVVANIPYYITSPILRYFTQGELRPDLMIIMMQEEVALDVTSLPGHMTFMSVSMQLFSRPELVFKVKSDCFFPRPKVDSAVVRFNMLKKPAIPVTDIEGFLQFVHAGFAAPRKQMRNSLAIGLKAEIECSRALLEKAGIDPQRRPGTLALDEWFGLFRTVEMGLC